MKCKRVGFLKYLNKFTLIKLGRKVYLYFKARFIVIWGLLYRNNNFSYSSLHYGMIEKGSVQIQIIQSFQIKKGNKVKVIFWKTNLNFFPFNYHISDEYKA